MEHVIVIKTPAEYAVIVRSLAKELPLYRGSVITDLNEVAGILEDLAKKEARDLNDATGFTVNGLTGD